MYGRDLGGERGCVFFGVRYKCSLYLHCLDCQVRPLQREQQKVRSVYYG